MKNDGTGLRYCSRRRIWVFAVNGHTGESLFGTLFLGRVIVLDFGLKKLQWTGRHNR